MTTIQVDGATVEVRRAVEADLPELVALLADDVLGATRESAPAEAYLVAFLAIDSDPNQYLAAVRDEQGRLAGTLQLTLIPGLSRGGALRLQIEAVRVAASARGAGLGAALFEWAHEFGRERGAVLAQLTTDKTRVDAHRFYERIGYTASHDGYKRPL